MKKKIIIISIIVALILLVFIFNPLEKLTKTILYFLRFDEPLFQSEKAKLSKQLYRAVYGRRVEKVKEVLSAGADPDYCRGESGWVDSNPLNVVAESFYDTYYRRQRGDTIPDPAPDVVVLHLLVKAGADINKRPYVWNRVYSFDNNFFKLSYDKSEDSVSMDKQLQIYIEDANRLIEAFLNAGADVDKNGHPYPFSYEAMKERITDKQADDYFAKGSRAINIAIGKGIVWESQVDLLLQYAKLDEDSLKAAELSGDSKMIEKISKLWQEQQNETKP